jgi:ubiquinone/menaquinone biosynthesis C-methylase UbiE
MTIEQFTRQAQHLRAAATIRNAEALNRMVELAELSAEDLTLDVACGPGLTVCAFAPHVRHSTGIDLTPAMLDEARQLQREKGLANITWNQGDVAELPYADGSFSVVTSRYAFHHFRDPLGVLGEMIRVTKSGGTLLISDSAPAAAKSDAFNQMEKLRDPSHVRALTVNEWMNLFRATDLVVDHRETFRLVGDLDSLLARSFPNQGDDRVIRQMFESALQDDFLDLEPRREEARIAYGFPIAVFRARKAAA